MRFCTMQLSTVRGEAPTASAASGFECKWRPTDCQFDPLLLFNADFLKAPRASSSEANIIVPPFEFLRSPRRFSFTRTTAVFVLLTGGRAFGNVESNRQ